MLAGSSGPHSLGDAWIQFLTIHVDSAGMLSVSPGNRNCQSATRAIAYLLPPAVALTSCAPNVASGRRA
jgi:hypothetical protein